MEKIIKWKNSKNGKMEKCEKYIRFNHKKNIFYF